MRFAVPQFIDVEDKIIGPLTIKQFLWLLAGAFIIFLIYQFGHLKSWALLITGGVVAGIFAGLAFIKMNGRPLIFYISAWVNYLIKPKLYIWHRNQK